MVPENTSWWKSSKKGTGSRAGERSLAARILDTMKILPIETPRLLLRGFAKEDARFAISIWNDAKMGEYLPDPAMEEIDEEYLHMVEGLGEDAECCYLIAVDKETGERIGTCSFIPSEEGRAYDIAYCVHASFWTQGYGMEIAEGLVGYARGREAKMVTIRINQKNAASNRIAQKLGFTVVGEKSYQKRGTGLQFMDNLYELYL